MIKQLDHFPGKQILDLAAILEATPESFKKGEIIFHHLSPAFLRLLIGIDSDGGVRDTGLRFRDTIDNKDFESYPNFAGKNPMIDNDDSTGTVRGVVKVTSDGNSANIDLIIQKFEEGDEGVEYSVTLIPGITMDESMSQHYYSLVVNHLKPDDLQLTGLNV